MKGLLLSIGLVASICQLSAQYGHKDIFRHSEGDELRNMLITSYKPPAVKSYSEARHFMFQQVYNSQDTVETIYAGFRRYLDPSGGDPIQYLLQGEQHLQIDTEHSYPRSKGADRDTDAGSDLHHLFPARKQINAARGSLPFGEVNDNQVNNWYVSSISQQNIPQSNIDAYSELGSDRFEPREGQKGNVARAIMYFYTMYRNEAEVADPQFFDLQVDDLCDWHYADPVDSLEWERSKMIGQFQGHEANPFVLDCSLAARLYCQEISDACAFLTSVEAIAIEDINAYPNPVMDVLKLDLGSERNLRNLSVHLMDHLGREVLHAHALQQIVLLNVSSLESGHYVLIVKDQNRIKGRKRIIKL
jgi:hypothetical protein